MAGDAQFPIGKSDREGFPVANNTSECGAFYPAYQRVASNGMSSLPQGGNLGLYPGEQVNL
jgi:hypothetical protein